MKQKKIAVLLLSIIIMGVFFTACDAGCFVGSRKATSDSYCLDIERMDGTDTHTLKLDAGDILDIHFETAYGELNIKIKAPDGTLIYTGNGKETTDFTVNISGSGEYSVCVTAHSAKGVINIKQKQHT